MLWWLFMALLHAAGIATAVRALRETRTPQGTIAWVVLLVTFPYVALPAYWVLGRSRFAGYVLERRRGFAQTDPRARAFLARLQERNLKRRIRPDAGQGMTPRVNVFHGSN